MKPRLKTLLILIWSSVFVTIMVFYRINLTWKITYFFLLRNLFLAWIPYGVTTFLKIMWKKIESKILIWFLFFVWLIFFPNAMYIITDFFHLKVRTWIPLWYDTLLLFGFARNGLILGFLSLKDIQNIFLNKIKKIWNRIRIVILLLLSSFGIYIWRFLRRNSRDIVTNPIGVITDTFKIMFDFKNMQNSEMILIYFVLLMFGYLTIHFIQNEDNKL